MGNMKGLSSEALAKFGTKHQKNYQCAIQLLTLPQADYINGIICEEGVIAPQSVAEVMLELILGYLRALKLSNAPKQLSVLCVF